MYEDDTIIDDTNAPVTTPEATSTFKPIRFEDVPGYMTPAEKPKDKGILSRLFSSAPEPVPAAPTSGGNGRGLSSMASLPEAQPVETEPAPAANEWPLNDPAIPWEMPNEQDQAPAAGNFKPIKFEDIPGYMAPVEAPKQEGLLSTLARPVKSLFGVTEKPPEPSLVDKVNSTMSGVPAGYEDMPKPGSFDDIVKPVVDKAAPEESWGEVLGEGAARGAYGVGRGIAGAADMASEIIPGIDEYAKVASDFYDKKIKANAMTTDPRSLKGYAGQIIESTVGSGMSMAFGQPVGLSMFFLTAAGNSYLEDRKAGVPKGTAIGRALVNGGLEAGTELIPMGILWKKGTPFMTRLLEMIVAEPTTEEINTIGNWMLDRATTQPNLTLGDLASQMYDTAIISLGQSLLMGGVGGALHKVAGTDKPAEPGQVPPPVVPGETPAPPVATNPAPSETIAAPGETTAPVAETGTEAPAQEKPAAQALADANALWHLTPEHLDAEGATYSSATEKNLAKQQGKIDKLNKELESLKGRTDSRAKARKVEIKDAVAEIMDTATADQRLYEAHADTRLDAIKEQAAQKAKEYGLNKTEDIRAFVNDFSGILENKKKLQKQAGRTVTEIFNDTLTKYLPSFVPRDYAVPALNNYLEAEKKKVGGGLVNEDLFNQTKANDHRGMVVTALENNSVPYRGWEADYPDLEEKYGAAEGAPAAQAPVTAQAPAVQPVAGAGRGKTDAMNVPGVGPVHFQYTIGEAGDTETSMQKDSWEKNPAYPQQYQPRKSSGEDKLATENYSNGILNKLIPEQLGESPHPALGASTYKIINGKPITMTGNTREKTLLHGYQIQHPNMEKYRQYLIANAEKFGTTPEYIKSLKAPVLRREILNDIDLEAYTRVANAPVAKTGAAADAAQDSRALTSGMLSGLAIDKSGELNVNKSMGVLRAFVSSLGPGEDIGAYNNKGVPSEGIIQRFKNALLHKALGGDANTFALMAVDTDTNIQSLANTITKFAPRLAQIDEQVKAGTLHKLSISKDIAWAANTLSDIRSKGISADQYLREGKVLDDGGTLPGRGLLRLFEDFSRAPNKLLDILNNYAQNLEALGKPGQGKLFENKTPSRTELLRAAMDAAGYDSRVLDKDYIKSAEEQAKEKPLGSVERIPEGKESAINRVLADAKLFGDGADTDALVTKGFQSLDRKAQDLVLSNVINSLDNKEVLGAIVKAVPVNVMNNLIGGKFSANDILRDKSMLSSRLSVPSNVPIGEPIISFINSLSSSVVQVPATLRTKKSGLGATVGPGTSELNPAVVTDKLSVDTQSNATFPGTEKLNLSGTKSSTLPGELNATGSTNEGPHIKTSIINGQQIQVNTTPTEGQIQAGNYLKGAIKTHGLDISIENPQGSTRNGVDKNGKPWETKLNNHYGYIKGYIGKDKDHVDVFLGDNHDSNKVFVVNQNEPGTGKLDEHKVMMGFNSSEEAEKAYRSNYPKGWKGLGSIAEMRVDGFKRWLKDGNKKEDAVSQVSIDTTLDPEATARSLEAALDDKPNRLIHTDLGAGKSGLDTFRDFWVAPDGKSYMHGELEKIEDKTGLINFHSHLFENWQETPDRAYNSLSSGDMELLQFMVKHDQGNGVAVITAPGTFDVLRYTGQSDPAFLDITKKDLADLIDGKISCDGDRKPIRAFAKQYGLELTEDVGFKMPEGEVSREGAKEEQPPAGQAKATGEEQIPLEQKQSHEMTSDEYAAAAGSSITSQHPKHPFQWTDRNGKILYADTEKQLSDIISKDHSAVVRQALSEGKPVPRTVLDEYKGETWAQKGETEKQTPEQIIPYEIGEKIGGARKDTSKPLGTRGTKAQEEEGPAWKKRYVAMEKVKEPGVWVIGDTRADSIVRDGWKERTFASQEEAEKMIPLVAVSRNHDVYQDGIVDGKPVYAIYRKTGERKRIKVVNQQFPSREDAMKYLATHPEEILNVKTSFGEEILPAPEKVYRKGVERRTEPATAKMFMDAYGFRGVEFGNWNNQDERQEVMNHAYDGLMDLADVLNLPPKALSLNGELALAFGARGQGLSGAKAHYERDYGIINLTKMSGAGSLAHEFLHALDHYLARLDTKASSEKIKNKRGDMVYQESSTKYDLQSHGASYNSKMREELKTAYIDLINTMYKKGEQYVEDTKKAEQFLGRARDNLKEKLNELRNSQYSGISKDIGELYQHRKIKKFTKPATAEQLAEFDRLANLLHEGNDLSTTYKYDEGSRIGSGRWTNDTLDALSKIYKEVRGRSGFSKEQNGPVDDVRRAMTTYQERIDLFKDAESKTEKTKKVPTNYLIEAKKIDQGRASDYWTAPHEMAARAFASYVEDKIAERGGQSDFLVYHAHGGILVPMIDGFVARPYPEGTERVAINKAFDNFVNTIKTKETDKGTALYSTAEKPTTGTTTEQVHAIIDPIVEKWKGFKNVNVVQSVDELSPRLQREVTAQQEKGQRGSVEGLYDPDSDTIHIIADNLSPDRIQTVLFSEAFRHKGMRATMGSAEMDRFLSGMWDVKGKEIAEIARQRGIKLNTEEGRLLAAEEYFAHSISEDTLPKGWMNRFARLFREFMRSIGVDLKLSDREIADIVKRSREAVEEGTKAQGKEAQKEGFGALASDPAYSVLDDSDFIWKGDKIVDVKPDVKKAIEAEKKAIKNRAVKDGTYIIEPDGKEHGLAPNGERSKLNNEQWVAVRTSRFKKWFGEWEELARQNEIDNFIDMAISGEKLQGEITIRKTIPEEVAEIKKQGGPDVSKMSHQLEASHIRHAINVHGEKNEPIKHPGQRQLTKDDIRRIPDVVNGYDELTVNKRGQNKTSIIYGKHFADGKVEYVERVIETSKENKPRLVTRTVWVSVETGVKSSPTRVSTPDHKNILAHIYGKVNKNSVSSVVDENGEPLVVWHGTPEKFTEFNIDKTKLSPLGASGGLGIFFSKNKQEAQHYAQKNGETVAAYVSIKNPKVIEKYTPEADKLFNSKQDAINLRKELQAQGYDGAITPLGEYVAFSPAQIKSATGNRGTYSEKTGDIRYSYIGQKAALDENAQRNLSIAKEMEQQGKDGENIRLATGWHKGKYSDQWEHEIDDSGIKIDVKLDDDGKGEQHAYLGDVVDHPELFKAYPQLKNTAVDITIDPRIYPEGTFIGKRKSTITGEDLGPEIEVSAGSIDEAKNILLHEIQHNIQSVEGWPRGGSVKSATDIKVELAHKTQAQIDAIAENLPRLQELQQKANRLTISDKDIDELKSIHKKTGISVLLQKATDVWGMNPEQLYTRLAGEIQARDVAARGNFTAGQRGESWDEAVSLARDAYKLQNSDKIQAEDDEFVRNGVTDEALKIRNNSPAHKKLFSLWDKLKALGYDMNQRAVQEGLLNNDSSIVALPPYSSENIPRDEAIIRYAEEKAKKIPGAVESGLFAAENIKDSNGDSEYTEIFKNPPAKIINAIKDEYGYFRMSSDGKDLYVWRGDMLHNWVARKVGIPIDYLLSHDPKTNTTEMATTVDATADDIKNIKELVKKYFPKVDTVESAWMEPGQATNYRFSVAPPLKNENNYKEENPLSKGKTNPFQAAKDAVWLDVNRDDLNAWDRLVYTMWHLCKKYPILEPLLNIQLNRDEMRSFLSYKYMFPNDKLHPLFELNKGELEKLAGALIKSDKDQELFDDAKLKSMGLGDAEVGAYNAWKKSMDMAWMERYKAAEDMTFFPYRNKSWIEDLKACTIGVKVEGKDKRVKISVDDVLAGLSKREQGAFLRAYADVKPYVKRLSDYRDDMGRIAFYFPRTRKQGDFTLKVYQYNGDERELIHLERFPNRIVGKQIEARLQKQFVGPEYQIQANYSPNTSEGVFQDLNDMTMAKFTDMALNKLVSEEKLGIDEATQLRDALFQSISDELKERGWSQHAIQRKEGLYVTGFETEDIRKVFNDYMTGMAGFITKQKAAYEMYEQLGKYEIKSQMYDFAKGYARDMLRNTTRLDRWSGRARGAAFGWYLAGNLKSAAVQFTQNFVTGIPFLARYLKDTSQNGILKAERKYMAAMKDVVTGNITAEEKALLHEALMKGETTDQYIREVSDRIGNEWNGAYRKVIKVLSLPFSGMEIYNRKSALIAMYRAAREQGGEVGPLGFNEEAAKTARDFVYDTHFLYGKTNLPEELRKKGGLSVFARTAYTFRSFNHNFILGMAQSFRGPGGKVRLDVIGRSLAYLAIFGGAAGIPWLDDLLDELERLMGTPYRNQMRKALKGVGGDILAQVGMSGLPALLGVDISGSMKIGIPAIGGSANEVFGVYSGLWQKGARAVDSLSMGQYYRAIEAALPTAGENVMRAYRESTQGATTPSGKVMFDRNGAPLKMTPGEAARQAIGFRPTRLSEESKIRRTRENVLTHYAQIKQDIGDRLRVGQDVGGRITKYNQDAAQYGGAVPFITARTLRSIMTQKPDKKMIILND